MTDGITARRTGFDYEGKVGAYLTELSNEKLTSKETKELVESLEGETAFDSDSRQRYGYVI